MITGILHQNIFGIGGIQDFCETLKLQVFKLQHLGQVGLAFFFNSQLEPLITIWSFRDLALKFGFQFIVKMSQHLSLTKGVCKIQIQRQEGQQQRESPKTPWILHFIKYQSRCLLKVACKERLNVESGDSVLPLNKTTIKGTIAKDPLLTRIKLLTSCIVLQLPNL